MATILVIEDEKDVLANLRDILEQEGYKTLGAETGRKGIVFAREYLPDLIVCDILMPELDGFNVLTEIREDARTASIPFIFLTAKTLREDVREGMNHGADDYLTKPYKINELLSSIKTQLKKRRSSFQQFENLIYTLTIALPHELRTPLTTIIGYSQFLIGPTFLTEPHEIIRIGESIYTSALRLSHLIDNYLLYLELKQSSHVIADKMRHSDVHSIKAQDIREFCEKKSAFLKRKNDIRLDLDEQSLSMSMKAFMKILEELLDNALKFSTPGSTILIKTRKDPQRYILQLSDNGHGMKPEYIRSIDAFKQFDRDIYEQQGLGLGLYITQQLAGYYGGSVHIESEYKIGTSVTVTFATVSDAV
ncbi:response regulator [bacterium]|nr:response regulator [bacterium]